MRIKSWNAIAIFSLALWPWILFLPATLGQGVFAGGDASSFFYPTRLEYARALAEWRLPLWEPGMQAGFPLFAEGQIAALYPPNLILYRLLPILLALSYSVMLHLSWASVGMYLLCRSSGLKITSAMLAGVTFAFSGFFLAHVQHLSLLATASWLPWMIFLWNRYRHAASVIASEAKQSPVSNLQSLGCKEIASSHTPLLAMTYKARLLFISVSISIAMQFLSGFPQIALLNLLAFSTIAIFDLCQPDHSLFIARGGMNNLIRIIGMIALGATLAAVQLLPTAELTTLSVRMQVIDQFFTSYSLDPIELSQFVFPFWSLGEPFSENQEFWGFVGVIPLMLAFIAPFVRRKKRLWFLLALGLIALWFALGESNPIYRLLYYVPLINQFRVPARFLFLFAFFAAYLAASGMDELQSRLSESSNSPSIAKWIGAAWVVGVIGFVLLRGFGGFGSWMNAWIFLPAIFLFAGIGLIVVALKRWLPASVLAVLLLGVSAIELTLFAIPFLFTLDALILPAQFTAIPGVVRALEGASPGGRVYTNYYHPLLRPNRPMTYGMQGAQIYSPLSLQRNDNYLNGMSPAMMNLINIRYIIEPLTALPREIPIPRATLPLALVGETITISPTPVTQVEMVSFAENALHMAEADAVGDLILITTTDQRIILPIRLGIETADWAIDTADATQVRHKKLATAVPFSVYSPSENKRFTGSKYVYRYSIPGSIPTTVKSIGVRLRLPTIGLTVESVSLIDDKGRTVSLAALSGGSNLELIYRDTAVDLYENRDTLPRAFIVHAAQIVADDQILARLQDPAFLPNRMVLLSEGAPMELPQSQLQNDIVEIISYKPERIEVKAQSDHPGYLILADSWFPGWTATVDAQSASIVRADYIFRAVPLASGTHSVVFEYRPASLAWGALISGVGALISLGALWRGRAFNRKV